MMMTWIKKREKQLFEIEKSSSSVATGKCFNCGERENTSSLFLSMSEFVSICFLILKLGDSCSSIQLFSYIL